MKKILEMFPEYEQYVSVYDATTAMSGDEHGTPHILIEAISDFWDTAKKAGLTPPEYIDVFKITSKSS